MIVHINPNWKAIYFWIQTLCSSYDLAADSAALEAKSVLFSTYLITVLEIIWCAN